MFHMLMLFTVSKLFYGALFHHIFLWLLPYVREESLDVRAQAFCSGASVVMVSLCCCLSSSLFLNNHIDLASAAFSVLFVKSSVRFQLCQAA